MTPKRTKASGWCKGQRMDSRRDWMTGVKPPIEANVMGDVERKTERMALGRI